MSVSAAPPAVAWLVAALALVAAPLGRLAENWLLPRSPPVQPVHELEEHCPEADCRCHCNVTCSVSCEERPSTSLRIEVAVTGSLFAFVAGLALGRCAVLPSQPAVVPGKGVRGATLRLH